MVPAAHRESARRNTQDQPDPICVVEKAEEQVPLSKGRDGWLECRNATAGRQRCTNLQDCGTVG